MTDSAANPAARHWLHRLLTSSCAQQLTAGLTTGERPAVAAIGSQGSSTTLLAGVIAQRLARPVLLVVPHLDDADEAVDDLALFEQAGVTLPARRFGALEVLPGESSVSLDLLAERLATVRRLAGEVGKAPTAQVLVAPVQALMQAVPQPDALGDWCLELRVGGRLSPAALLDWLASAGYERVDAIETPGQFAVRGGIVDLYPPATVVAPSDSGNPSDEPATLATGPVRVDFFGDEIDTLCRVDPDTLGSGDRLQQVQLLGARFDQLQRDDRTTALWTLLHPQTIVILHETMELAEQARGYYERLSNPVGIYAPATVFAALTKRPHAEFNQYSRSTNAKAATVRIPVRPLPSYDENAAKAVAELGAQTTDENYRPVVVLCPQPAERERLLELLGQHAPAARADIVLEVGYLHRGFVWEAEQVTSPARQQGVAAQPPLDHPPAQTPPSRSGLVQIHPAGDLLVLPHQELFHRFQARRRIRKLGALGQSAEMARVADAFLDLNVGDHVVHSDHGIARFVGLRPMKGKGADSSSEEYLTLEFAGRATLHVPVSQIDLVQKYVGGFQGVPPLSTLGGRRWAKQKEQVAEAVKDLAAELLRIQAARASMPGIRYPEDTPWQHEFEAEFPYEETEDQLAAITAMKRDMARDQPMDRLICGDVGFGKTEVAIRGAFKAVEAGKQVAVLVPTTVLAEQHERTFRDRMAEYPFRVESLSRFKTAGEQRKVLEAVAAGQVDIIIGTHRLLSADVRFADLGMVIIDEEQRFGVEHKNKLLQFRLTADVMTLSATPIPRTLHMAMLGLRDISSLTIAPMDRRAIVTEVIPYNRKRVQQAIVRELNREGQVYFVHNRVHNIQSVADELQTLAPSAKIIIGHGQMAPRDLEKVMLRFIRRQADILVCTTIIESGIDIPTANTMFINEADHFGLAELHQLRGRVGRYKHRAYCYLLLPEKRTITDKALQRLRAIEQYAMLGAGFKIAMRDLEIRGAGNLLGAEQSGHIAAVGYEMYCQLLEQATKKLRHEPIIEAARTHLELPLTGSLPKAYIASDKFRMEAYRRLSRAESLEQLDAVARDLRDAYGPPPAGAQSFLDLAELRIACTLLEIEKLKLEGPDLIFTTQAFTRLEPLFVGAPGRVSLIDERTVYYRPPANYLTPASTLLAVLRKLLVRPLRPGNIAKG